MPRTRVGISERRPYKLLPGSAQTYRWDTRLAQTIASACTMAGRNLTTDEWTQAFGTRPYEKTCP